VGGALTACQGAAQQGINSEFLENPSTSCKNTSRKPLRIQSFAKTSEVNSLRDGTGNQFDHNRGFNWRQQRINSQYQGINPALRIGTERWLDSGPLALRKHSGDAQ